MLRLPGRQCPEAAVEQATAGRRLRVHLQQRAAGQLGGAAACRVGETSADMAEAEVGDLPVAVPDGLREHGRAEEAVEQPKNPGGPVIGGESTLRKPGSQRLRAKVGEGGELAAERVAEAVERSWPADQHDAQGHAFVPEREHGLGAARPAAHQRPAVACWRPGRAPDSRAAQRGLVLQAGHLRGDPPPAAGLARPETGLPGELQAPVRLGQPQGHRGGARGAEHFVKHGGRDGAAVRRSLDGGPGQAEPLQAVLGQDVRGLLVGDLGGQLGNARARFGGQLGQLSLSVRR